MTWVRGTWAELGPIKSPWGAPAEVVGLLERPLTSYSSRLEPRRQPCEIISETHGKVLEAVRPGESSRTMIMPLGGRTPSRPYDKDSRVLVMSRSAPEGPLPSTERRRA